MVRFTHERRKHLKGEFERFAEFKVGDEFKNPHRSGTFTVSDFAYRWEDEEFVYWMDDGREEWGPYSQHRLYGFEEVEEDGEEDDPDIVGPRDKPF